jgi:hypothetical protein
MLVQCGTHSSAKGGKKATMRRLVKKSSGNERRKGRVGCAGV